LPDLFDDPFLRSGEGERELFVVERVEHASDLREEEAVVFGQTRRTARLDVELNAQQFVEFQAVLRLPQQLGRLREVDVVEGVAQREQPVLRPQGVGQRLRDAAGGQRPRIADDLVQALGTEYARQPFGRRVDALHAAFGLAAEGLFHGLDLRMYEREFVAVERRAAE